MQCGDVALVVEIVARAGPMMAFKIERVPLPEPGGLASVVRTVGLPDNLLPVRILDFEKACDARGNLRFKKSEQLPYIVVHAEEFYEALEYAHAIDVKSLTFQNVFLFCRRRSRGMKLINRELVAAWRLWHDQLNSFVVAVVCLTLQDTVRASNFIGTSLESRVLDNGLIGQVTDRLFGAFTRAWTNFMDLYLFVRETGLIDRLVLTEVQHVEQLGFLRPRAKANMRARPDPDEVAFVDGGEAPPLDLETVKAVRGAPGLTPIEPSEPALDARDKGRSLGKC